MKFFLKSIQFFFVAVIVSSCYSPRYIYSPPTQNVPALYKKNDFEVSGFYSGLINDFKTKKNYNRGFDLHAAWAINNHFAVMLNETARWEKNGTNDTYFYGDNSLLSYKISFTEIGAGYFTPVKNNYKMQFQIFGGAAFGSLKISDDFTSNSLLINKYYNSRITKFFVQPSFIYTPVKNISTAFSSRFTELLYKHIKTNYTLEEQDNYILDSVTVAPVFFWEPAVTYTLGFKKFPFKIRLQGSISVLLNHRFVEYRSTNVGLGIVSDLSKKKKIKTATSKS